MVSPCPKKNPSKRRNDALPGRFLVCGAAWAILSTSPGLRAEEAPEQGPAPSTQPPVSPNLAPEGSTLTRLAQQVRTLNTARPSLVAVAPAVASHLAREELVALTNKIRTVVGAAVPEARYRPPHPMAPDVARQRARELDLSLVLLSPSLQDGNLSLVVDVIEWPNEFWARTRAPEGTITTHLVFSETADAEIRQFLPSPPGLFTKRQRFESPVQKPIALACGDAEGNGGQALLVVSRRELRLGRFTSTSFKTLARVSWDELSPLSPHPLRAPLASAWIHQGHLYVGLSDRSHLVWLDASLAPRGFAPPAAPSAHGCHRFTSTGLAEAPVSCGPFHSVPPPLEQPAPHGPSLSAIAQASITHPNGTSTQIVIESPIGKQTSVTLVPPSSEKRTFSLPQAGNELKAADLDGDSQAEILSSKNTEDPNEDALVIQSVDEQGLEPRATLDEGPVHALAVCPFAGKNPQTVVAAVGDSLWVLR